MLEFYLNENRYAIEIERISAIVEMKDITRFPRGPDAIDGVTDLRGEITGVLDPTTMLDVERNECSDDQYIVVLKRDDDKQKLGIRVTDVSQAVTYRESQIDETGTVMDTTTDHQHEFIEGIIKKTPTTKPASSPGSTSTRLSKIRVTPRPRRGREIPWSIRIVVTCYRRSLEREHRSPLPSDETVSDGQLYGIVLIGHRIQRWVTYPRVNYHWPNHRPRS